jgi:renalase
MFSPHHPLHTPRHAAVVGSGLAGAACAEALLADGWAVTVWDKARGPGGRLATRRMGWRDTQGTEHPVALDHGAVGLHPVTPEGQAWVAALAARQLVHLWQPRPQPGSHPLAERAALWVPQPSLPALCQHLVRGAHTQWDRPVSALHREAAGWRLDSGRQHFDAVLLALPPAQAEPLLAAHEPEWAQRAAMALMQPCWTLMGVASAEDGDTDWDASHPASGPLAWLARNESRPGREPAHPGTVHWVAHASAAWSRAHLEMPAEDIKATLQDAVATALGHPVHWRCCTVHRWRYAQPHAYTAGPQAQAWWRPDTGLGVCGDFLGGAGLEGAWQSGRTLAAKVIHSAHMADDAAASAVSA